MISSSEGAAPTAPGEEEEEEACAGQLITPENERPSSDIYAFL